MDKPMGFRHERFVCNSIDIHSSGIFILVPPLQNQFQCHFCFSTTFSIMLLTTSPIAEAIFLLASGLT